MERPVVRRFISTLAGKTALAVVTAKDTNRFDRFLDSPVAMFLYVQEEHFGHLTAPVMIG